MNEKIIIFNSRDELHRINVSKIVYFEGDGNYTTIVTSNKLKFSVGINLSQMEKGLAERLGKDAVNFMRIGKRFIVNINYICQINVLKQHLILTDYDKFTYRIGVSKEALRQIKKILSATKKND
jgi:DNA-binding LytR/AlgR family response regulator